MKHALVILAATLLLSGCYPAFRTVQPRVRLVVLDPSGRPIEGAKFTLATYRLPLGSPTATKFIHYETNSAGAVAIARRGDWQMEALLPDGSSWYAWRYCIEKEGYRAGDRHAKVEHPNGYRAGRSSSALRARLAPAEPAGFCAAFLEK